MVRRLFLLTMAFVFCAFPLIAEESDRMAARRLLISQVLEQMEANRLFSDVLRSMLYPAMAKQPGEFEPMRDKLLAMIDFKKASSAYAALLDKYFTEEELKDLKTFYKSSSGQKLIQTLPLMYEATLEQSYDLMESIKQEAERNKKNPWEATLSDMRTIATAVEAYLTDQNHYPKASTLDDLGNIISPIYIRALPKLDGWRHPYRYIMSSDSQHYRIVSGGADGKIEIMSEVVLNSPVQGVPHASDDMDEDIIYQDGQFLQYPRRSSSMPQ